MSNTVTVNVETIISNSFTGYCATIRTNGKPVVSTIQKHVRNSKASDCKSVTLIFIDGSRHELQDLGNGYQLMHVY